MKFATDIIKSRGYYDDTCAMCANLNLNNYYKEGFECKTPDWRKRLPLDQERCKPYFKRINRDLKTLETALEELKRRCGAYYPRGFYIMTAVCNILGYDYRTYIDFGLAYRHDYLEQQDYDEFLEQYDDYGKYIASQIEKSDKKEVIARDLFNMYLFPFYNLVINSEFEEALALYLSMLVRLEKEYPRSEETPYVRSRTIVDND